MKDTPQQTPASEATLGPLAESLGLLLRLAQLSAFEAFFEAFEGSSDDGPNGSGIRPGEVSVLILISENPGIRQGTLANRLRIKRAHMTKMVQAFEAAGLVTRRVPEDDRRGIVLSLTEAGENHVAALHPRFAAHENTAPSTLSATETATLKRLLRKYLEIPEEGSPG